MAHIKSIVDDCAPEVDVLLPYDEERLSLYLRLLDAEAEGANWRQVAQIVLGRDPEAQPEITYQCWQTHLKRARWIAAARYEAFRDGKSHD